MGVGGGGGGQCDVIGNDHNYFWVSNRQIYSYIALSLLQFLEANYVFGYQRTKYLKFG